MHKLAQTVIEYDKDAARNKLKLQEIITWNSLKVVTVYAQKIIKKYWNPYDIKRKLIMLLKSNFRSQYDTQRLIKKIKIEKKVQNENRTFCKRNSKRERRQGKTICKFEKTNQKYFN